jgi:hypothetical protein
MTMSSEQQKLSERLRAQLEGAAAAADGGIAPQARVDQT